MFCFAQHDRRRKPLQRFITSANHSGFSTRVRSRNSPLATLKPRVEKIFQSCGGSAKSVPYRCWYNYKTWSGLDMKSTAFVEPRDKALHVRAKIPNHAWFLELDGGKLRVRLQIRARFAVAVGWETAQRVGEPPKQSRYTHTPRWQQWFGTRSRDL